MTYLYMLYVHTSALYAVERTNTLQTLTTLQSSAHSWPNLDDPGPRRGKGEDCAPHTPPESRFPGVQNKHATRHLHYNTVPTKKKLKYSTWSTVAVRYCTMQLLSQVRYGWACSSALVRHVWAERFGSVRFGVHEVRLRRAWMGVARVRKRKRSWAAALL